MKTYSAVIAVALSLILTPVAYAGQPDDQPSKKSRSSWGKVLA